jgi:hypothetical protein
MSQTTPFGTPAAPAPPDTPEPETGPERDRTKLIVVVAGVLVLAVAAWFFFLRGGDEPLPDTGSALPTAAKAAPGADGAKATDKAADADADTDADADRELPDVYDGGAGRDPFKPLVHQEEQKAETAGQPAAAAGAPAAATTGGAPLTGLAAAPGVPGLQPTGPETVAAPASPVDVTLEKISRDDKAAKLTVGGQSYKAKVGDVFAGAFKPLRLADGCGTFQYGDESFELCTGDTTRLR